jgi:DMSO/TMAO reductase YedYZ molybdopterin-dependent catalytic subunit
MKPSAARSRGLKHPIPVPREEDFTSRWHDERVATRVGLLLGPAFAICFVTGLLSHFIQHPTPWFFWPAHPAWLYRATQGTHVLTGIAAVPLLLVKLWTVYPRLFTTPPARSVLHALERISILALVSSAGFELMTGLQNIAQWYPWGFYFPSAHYAVAWLAIGALLVHIAVKLPAIRRALGVPLDEPAADDRPPELSRRWLLGGAIAGSATVLLATAGMTVPWLRRISVLAVRSGHGPQGVPVNRSAASARIAPATTDAGWQLSVTGPARTIRLSRAQLSAMPQHTYELPIACVEGWSASAHWTGVRVRDLVAAVGGEPGADVRFTSLEQAGLYRSSVLPARHARDELSLLALRLNGEDLDLDHGFPCRLIAPSRPGVLQTKWLSGIEVLA